MSTPKHATVIRDGYEVPLIGVPESSVLETCQCCGEVIGLLQTVLTGTQALCWKCAQDQTKAPEGESKT